MVPEQLIPVKLIQHLLRFESTSRILQTFMMPEQLIPVELVQHFRRAIINIHPGLLPAFGGKGLYGQRVHKAVVASGARYTGTHAPAL